MSASGLVMCGCHISGAHLLPPLIEAGFGFDYFVVLTPEQGARYGVSGYADLRPLAEKHRIPVYVPRSYTLSDAQDIEFFEKSRFRLLIQGGWQRLFPKNILATLSLGAVGVHGSSDFLPKGRGRSPLNWSLIEGRSRFLMHLFLMTAGVDDGEIFDVEAFDINPFDDIETLYLKNSIVTRRMLIRGIPRLLSGDITPWKQAGKPSYYPKRTPRDALIDWEDMDVAQIYNFIRAQTRPYPGAYAQVEGKWLRLWRARPLDTRITYPGMTYGAIAERLGERLVINCRGGLLLVDEWEKISAPPSE